MSETGLMGIEQKRKDDWVGRVTALVLTLLIALPLLALAWVGGLV